jgi:hypothetical protein
MWRLNKSIGDSRKVVLLENLWWNMFVHMYLCVHMCYFEFHLQLNSLSGCCSRNLFCSNLEKKQCSHLPGRMKKWVSNFTGKINEKIKHDLTNFFFNNQKVCFIKKMSKTHRLTFLPMFTKSLFKIAEYILKSLKMFKRYHWIYITLNVYYVNDKSPKEVFLQSMNIK